MREAVVSYAKYPQNKWRCVTELGIPAVSEQRLLDTSRVFEILSHPGVTYKTEDFPVFIGERAIRHGMHLLGIVEADPEKDARIEELEAEVASLRELEQHVFYSLDHFGEKIRKKPGPKQREAA